MIVFITTHGHGYTIKPLMDGSFGAAVPRIQKTTYDRIFRPTELWPRATYVFTDMERMYPWELSLAAELYRALRAAGLRCLNDPARVMGRYELLKRAHAAGLNPFDVYPATDRPRPRRWPVFIRGENDHRTPVRLLQDQVSLDSALEAAVAAGQPLSTQIVIEFCAETAAPGLWRKFGTYGVGSRTMLDHHSVGPTWAVKYTEQSMPGDEAFEVEAREVRDNRYADELRPFFELAGIEYGRADHATVGGRQVVYEINTNPAHWPLNLSERTPLRQPTRVLAHTRFGELLDTIDTPEGAPVRVEAPPGLVAFKDREPPHAVSYARP